MKIGQAYAKKSYMGLLPVILIFHVILDLVCLIDRYVVELLPKHLLSDESILLSVLISSFLLCIACVYIIKRHLSGRDAQKAYPADFVSELQSEIERQKKMIHYLTNLYHNAVDYERRNTEFFSNISHELKTPLSIILGAIQLMEQRSAGIENKSNKHLYTIRQNCYRLLRLINNLLDITRIESGFVKLNLHTCNVVYVIEEITQSVVSYAEQKNISLEFDTQNEEIIAAVDTDKIERIILNLLSNAIKFTPSGGKILVGVKESQGKILISVKDSGCGIPKEMQASIFERFRQVNSSLTRDAEGSGIGLSLVKFFVNLHGGTIDVKSEVQKGSEFIIQLPLRQCEDEAENHFDARKSQNKIIEAINIEFSDIYSVPL